MKTTFDDEPIAQGALPRETVATLVANHREFLRFVEGKVGDRATAE